MCRKLMFLISLVSVLGLVGVASAADYHWTNAYEWSYLYISPDNWEPEAPYGGPGDGDTAFIDPCGPIILDTDITVDNIRGPLWGGSADNQDMLLIGDCNLFVNDRWETRGDEELMGKGYIWGADDAKVFVDGRFYAHGEHQKIVINLSDNADFHVKNDLRCGDEDDDYFELNMTGNSYLYAGNDDDGFRNNEGELHVSVSGSAVLEAEYIRWRSKSEDTTCTLDISENGQVIVNDDDFQFAGGSSDFVITLSDNAVLDIDGCLKGGEDNDFDATWTLNMNDPNTLITMGDDLRFIDDDDADGSALINLNSGLIDVDGGTRSDTDNWLVNITEGVMVLTEDRVGDVLDDAADGHWMPYPVDIGGGEILARGDMVVEYDTLEYPLATKISAVCVWRRAWNPNPKDGATDVPSRGTVLTWSAGDFAVTHHLFLSTNYDLVNIRDYTVYAVPGGFPDPCYDPGPLMLDTTYYWAVDEQDAGIDITPGLVWQFKVETSRSVEDMEEYTSNPNYIFDTWVDGYGDVNGVGGNGTGALVDLETGVVHSGDQSMIYYYDNLGPPYRDVNYSEATRAFSETQDWVASNEKALVIWFRGNADNESAPMYVVVNGNNSAMVKYDDNPNVDPEDIKTAEWIDWNVNLGVIADAGVDLANVDSFTIGFGERLTNEGGGNGIVYFDDMALYTTRCVPKFTFDINDLNDDCVVDWEDIGVLAGSWLEDRR